MNWDQDYSLLQGSKQGKAQASGQVTHSVNQGTSLPLLIDIRGGGQMFAQVPQAARAIKSSVIKFLVDGCLLRIHTGPPVVDQYLWTGTWVKFKMGLDNQYGVMLDPMQDGNFRINVDLAVDFTPGTFNACRKVLYGRRIYLGAFHVNKSLFGLIPAPGSPLVAFKERGHESKSYKIYLNWPRGAAYPQLLDHFDVPANLASPIYRAQFGRGGAYYLTVLPALVRLKPKVRGSKGLAAKKKQVLRPQQKASKKSKLPPQAKPKNTNLSTKPIGKTPKSVNKPASKVMVQNNKKK